MEKYRFTEQGHRHELLVDGKWKRLTGCTTVLDVLAKNALIQWSANMAVEHFKKNKKRLEEEFDEVCSEAQKAYAVKRDKAGDLGTDIHAICERIIKESIKTGYSITTKEVRCNRDNKQVNHFLNWATENKVKFFESEKSVYSEKLFLGGVVDFICEIDGEIWIGDIKTGNGIYPEAFGQIAGYHIMLEEMGLYPDIKGYVVVNLKKDGTFAEKRSISNDVCQKFFLSALDIYRTKAKITNLIK